MMDSITIFFFDHLVGGFVLVLAALSVYTMITGKRSRPKYRLNQRVLGQNYKTKNGDYVPCKVIRVFTEYSETGFEHYYELKVLDQNIVLQVTEDRLKPVE